MVQKILLSFLLFVTIQTRAQNFAPVDGQSRVHFVIRNFGFNTGGDLTGLKGSIFFNPAFPASAKFDITVDAASIDTDNSSRDKDLKEAPYFEVEKFPVIRLVSTKIDKTNKTDDGYYYFTGNLTIKDVTKTISFPFQAQKQQDDFIFTGEFTVNRLDFGVGEKSTVLSNTVTVSLKVLAARK